MRGAAAGGSDFVRPSGAWLSELGLQGWEGWQRTVHVVSGIFSRMVRRQRVWLGSRPKDDILKRQNKPAQCQRIAKRIGCTVY